MPLVYLDNCALQRPLDARDQFRVRVEADAITTALAAVEAGDIALATSAVLRAEAARGQNRSRRDFAERALALATRDVSTTEPVEELARKYQDAGMKPFDALHLASAVSADADYFCTVDDRLLRLARTADTRRTQVVTPLELASTLSL